MEIRIVLAESNFIQDLLYKIYVGTEEFTDANWKSLSLRLQSIRDEIRKHDDEKNCS